MNFAENKWAPSFASSVTDLLHFSESVVPLCKISPLSCTEVLPFVFVSYWPLEGTNASACSACCLLISISIFAPFEAQQQGCVDGAQYCWASAFFWCTYKDRRIVSEHYYLRWHAQAGTPARSQTHTFCVCIGWSVSWTKWMYRFQSATTN